VSPIVDHRPDHSASEPPGFAAYAALALLAVSGVTALHAMYVGWSHLW
jgi:hypothetical protein